LAFTRNPSDTSVSPATYTADGASDLILVDQQRNIAIDGSNKDDSIVASAVALSSSALYNYNVRGFDGDDDIILNAALVQSSVINGNVGNDFLSVGDRIVLNDDGFPVGIIGAQVNFNNSYLLGGKGDDTLTGDDVNGGEINGNIGNDIIFVDNDVASGFNQYIGGGQGNDLITIQGNYTDSIIDGNKGIDTIIISDGIHSGSSVNGGEGNDVIRSSGLSKGLVINGDIGNDTIAATGNLGSTITGGEGKDTIVSSALVGQKSTIDAGVGADTIVTIASGINSAATETIIFESGDSVAATKTSFANAAGINNTLAAGETITFGNGVDFLNGVNTDDKIDIDFDPDAVVDVTGALLTDVLTAGTIYEVYGTFANNVFTVGATTKSLPPQGIGPDSIYIVGGENLTLGQVFTNSTNMFVTTEDLGFASFV